MVVRLLIISLMLLVLLGCTKPTIPETGVVKEFEITAKNWVFEPGVITVNYGDEVKLTIIGLDDGTGSGHGIAIPAFGIDRVIRKNDRVVIEFIANKKGTFPFYCSVYCGDGHADMTGKLIVK